MEVTKVNSEFPTSEDSSHDGFVNKNVYYSMDNDGESDDDDVKSDVGDLERDEDVKEEEDVVSISGIAAKIDAHVLAAYLNDITDPREDAHFMTFVMYFLEVFENVSGEQFPHKLFRESSIEKMANLPISYISEAVYKTSVDWLNKYSNEKLGEFVLLGLDIFLSHFTDQQSGGQIGIFIALSMVLRTKPDVLINIFPELRKRPVFQGENKLPVILWTIAQASQGDLSVGLYAWGHHTLPLLGFRVLDNLSVESRDLVLQLVEWILSAPKARTILVNGAVRKGGERLLPPAVFAKLLVATFPLPLSWDKYTNRYEAIYPTLKEVALAGSPGSTAMKQVSKEIMEIALGAAREGVPELSGEGMDLFIWCLSQSPDSYKLWDQFYLNNLEVSVKILKKLSDEWRKLSTKQSSVEALSETLKSFLQKNEIAMMEGGDVVREAFLKDADNYSKVLLTRLSRGHEYLKSLAFVALAVAFGAGLLIGAKFQSFETL